MRLSHYPSYSLAARPRPCLPYYLHSHNMLCVFNYDMYYYWRTLLLVSQFSISFLILCFLLNICKVMFISSFDDADKDGDGDGWM